MTQMKIKGFFILSRSCFIKSIKHSLDLDVDTSPLYILILQTGEILYDIIGTIFLQKPGEAFLLLRSSIG
jgi:hypothetical protein